MSLLVDSPERFAASRPKRRSVVGTSQLAPRLYVPACLIVGLASVLIAIGWSIRWGGQSLVGYMTSFRVVVIGPATLVVLAALLIAERVWPAQDRPLFARGHRQDLLYALFNATLVVPFVAAVTLSFSLVVRTRLPFLTFPRIAALPHALVITAIMIAMDGCNWAAHLANHRVRVLWRFHELHHSQEDMNALTVFRTHPFVHVVYLVALLPGIVLLANGTLPSVLLVVYTGTVALAHSNIRLNFGPLGRIFVSPNYHRIHHRPDARQDVNLGFALTIWDQLFHTAIFPTRETVAMKTGLAGRPIAVENAGERPHHLAVFVAQMMAPFRPLSEKDTALPSWSLAKSDGAR